MDKVKRVCLWSGPRNISTALMYAFAQREDTRVVDEPLYGHYLRASGADHPLKIETMESMECDGEKVARGLILGPCARPVLFMKQMTHHLIEMERGFLGSVVNVVLTRDPVDMLPSLEKALGEIALVDTGYRAQYELFEQLRALGQEPPVLEARELLLNPRGVLEQLCERLELPFDEGMLAWETGGRPEDGVWAAHWYANVHRSHGFQPYRPKTEPFPERLRALLDECRPYYEALYAHALKGEQ